MPGQRRRSGLPGRTHDSRTGPGHDGLVVAVLLALRLVLELCLLAAAAVIGLALTDRISVGIMASVALVAAVGILWGVLLAPRRRVDLPLPARVAIELALFVSAGIGLAVVGHTSAGLALVAAELLLLPLLSALGHPPGSLPQSEPHSL